MKWILMLMITGTACAATPEPAADRSPAERPQTSPAAVAAAPVLPGAHQTEEYLPLLRGKRVGVVANQTSVVGTAHLVDTLRARGVDLRRVFTPEHGFRGTADAGEAVSSSTDARTGLPIVSLYGDNKKPRAEQLADLDVVVFDLQDVGARFYTYISTLHYVMEACAAQKLPLVVLDRPNPNGHYVDGPVREEKYKSFVGMHPIPIVHGLTVGELAGMINGEGWLPSGAQCSLTVVKVQNYTHQTPYRLPIRPSPNLPNSASVDLYPSLCLFEGTVVSVGRGTLAPFQVIGAPDTAYGRFTFTPVSMPGSAKSPPYQDQKCYGTDLRNAPPTPFTLRYLIDYYRRAPQKESFFNNFFNLLAGNASLRALVEAGASEADIRQSWEPALGDYKVMRLNYLLYPK